MCVRISCSITLTEEKIRQYAFLSGDFNKIHLDLEEAARFGFKAPIAHGMLTMGLALEVASSFTGQGMRVSAYEMSFLKPVFQGETIQIVAEKVERDGETICLKVIGRNSDNEQVVRGAITVV